jgi:hypothetical protein
MIRIHQENLNSRADMCNFFDINNFNDYCFVDKTNSADIDFSLDWTTDPRFHTVLILPLFHMYENQMLDILKWVEDKRVKVITNVCDLTIKHDSIYFCDYLYNRQKAYAQNYPFSTSTVKWYYTESIDYDSKSLKYFTKQPKKIFVSPTNTQSARSNFRSRLFDLLFVKFGKLGYVGNPANNIVLISNSDCPIISDIDNLDYNFNKIENKRKAFSPPHQSYYDNTFLSIYGETIEYGSTIGITEKTFTPLIRGHFILPFSTCGFVKYLQSRGIRLPSFIDYSYDDIFDDQQRISAFFDEVHRLLSINLDQWHQYYVDNLDLLIYNQTWFDNEYDRVDLTQILDQN